MILCAASQFGLCFLLFKELIETGITEYEVNWKIHVARLVCCLIMHFAISQEVISCKHLMKFVALNSNKFERPYLAFFICVIQFSVTIFIEFVNIYNLVM